MMGEVPLLGADFCSRGRAGFLQHEYSITAVSGGAVSLASRGSEEPERPSPVQVADEINSCATFSLRKLSTRSSPQAIEIAPRLGDGSEERSCDRTAPWVLVPTLRMSSPEPLAWSALYVALSDSSRNAGRRPHVRTHFNQFSSEASPLGAGPLLSLPRHFSNGKRSKATLVRDSYFVSMFALRDAE